VGCSDCSEGPYTFIVLSLLIIIFGTLAIRLDCTDWQSLRRRKKAWRVESYVVEMVQWHKLAA
jgi:hypothetical protein